MKKKTLSRIGSILIIILYILSIEIFAIYMYKNPLNTSQENEDEIIVGNYKITIRHERFFSSGDQQTSTEDDSEETVNPFRPIRLAPLASGKYLVQPTSFTDSLGYWSNEVDAYDWNNGTNADLGSKSDCDLDLITWNTTDNEGETITRVDIRFRIDVTGLSNDYVEISWYVGATQGSGTYTINSGNEGNDIEVTFNDVSEPNDASWSWTDVGNINVRTHYEKVTGSDVSTVGIDECWGWVTIEPPVPDETPPDISSPSDQEVELGSTGNSIEWTVGDQNPDDYRIYRNDSIVEEGSWTNGTIDADSGECDGLAVGVYNFTCFVNDTSNNIATDTVWFTVSDTTAPSLDSPSDDQYNEGSSGNTISWTVSELSPNDYICYRNGTPHDSGSYSDGVPIVVDIDGLSLGVYNFTMWVDDDYGYTDVDLVWITVTAESDEDDPIFDSPPSDDSYELGSTSNSIDWNATDVNPDSYVIYRNSTPIDSGSYTNDTYISINIDGLGLGIYNFTCYVNDSYGNWVVDLCWITVEDTTSPSLDSPSDDTIELGSTDDWVNWTCTDLDSDNYIVYYNSSEWDSGSWTSGISINVSLDGLTLGLWNFTIICFDSSGNSDVDLVWILCEDTTSPEIDSPSDDSYQLGSTGNWVNWTCTDLDSDNFICYKNETEWDTGSWTSGVAICIDIDGLSVGIYNFTIICFDGSSNYVVDLVWITVTDVDSTPPNLNSPANMTYTENTSGHIIIWIATDDYPDNFTVYCEGSPFSTGTWESGVNININVDGLAGGWTYNITILVQDDNSNKASSTVWVTVIQSSSAGPNLPIPTTPTSEVEQIPVEVVIAISIVFFILFTLMVIITIKRKTK